MQNSKQRQLQTARYGLSVSSNSSNHITLNSGLYSTTPKQDGNEMSIKNGDLPAMPAITLSEVESNGGLKYELKTECVGLTKREQFAMAMAQGLVSSGMDWTLYDHRDVSEQAIIMADALLAELERTK